MAQRKYILLTSGTSWTVPADWNSVDNIIHLIGGGGGGQITLSGGGGGYTKITNFSTTPGSSITYAIGAGGSGASAGGNTTFNAGAYSAGGGGAGSGTTGGAAGVGSTSNGGSGGYHASFAVGGGGAGGPYGNGTNGGSLTLGVGDAGYGGSLGSISQALQQVANGLEIWPGVAGSGGGAYNQYGPAGLFGGGGGASTVAALPGAQGAIIIEYRGGGFYTSTDESLQSLYVDDYTLIDEKAATGSLWSWGNGTPLIGSNGDNTSTTRSSPVQTVSGGTNWKQVSYGGLGGGGIKTDGTLWMWGNDSGGLLGDNSSIDRTSPVQTVSGGTNWAFLSCRGGAHAAIKTDGTLWTWGSNSAGAVGDNTNTVRSSPVQTVAGGTNWKIISGGNCMGAIKNDGTLWLWGQNTNGELGDNSATHRSSPVQTVSGGNNWKSIATEQNFSAAIKVDGTLWTWGDNTYGQLGDNTVNKVSSPIQTVAGGTTWKQVSTGSNTIAAIKTDSTLWVWGKGDLGQLGDNTITNKSSPVQTVAGGTNWKQVSVALSSCAAVKTDGTLWTWGHNQYGKLGTNDAVHRSSPVQTAAGGTNWKMATAGGSNSAGIYFYDAGNLYPSA